MMGVDIISGPCTMNPTSMAHLFITRLLQSTYIKLPQINTYKLSGYFTSDLNLIEIMNK